MKKRALGLMLMMDLLVACGIIIPSPTPANAVVEGQVTVERVEVVMLMSFPLQVHLQVTGYVDNPCIEIDEILTERDGTAFEVLITTERDAQANCIQVIEPFEKSIPLDVYGLPAGNYSVSVNGVTTEFTFNQDNILGE